MSADLLLRAAAKLRETANAATPGPWTAAKGTENNWVVDGDSRPGDHAWVALMMFGECEADARFISTVHPPVALGLADVFERLDAIDLNGVDNDLLADLEHLAAQVLGEDGESR